MVNNNTAKVIIAGSRGFDDYEYLEQNVDFKLSELAKVNHIEIVAGGARGADRLAERFAKRRDFTLTIMKADWNTHGKSAGYIRNKEMADYADYLIAFWDGSSPGTKHMIDTAKENGLRVTTYLY